MIELRWILKRFCIVSPRWEYIPKFGALNYVFIPQLELMERGKKDVEFEYKEEKAHFEMSFSLQKGSYATVVLEELLSKNL